MSKLHYWKEHLTRNLTKFSLHFSTIYYDFSKFQLVYCKRALRSTIHLSHGLRKKAPALLSIAARGPYGGQRRSGLKSGEVVARRRRWRGGGA